MQKGFNLILYMCALSTFTAEREKMKLNCWISVGKAPSSHLKLTRENLRQTKGLMNRDDSHHAIVRVEI